MQTKIKVQFDNFPAETQEFYRAIAKRLREIFPKKLMLCRECLVELVDFDDDTVCPQCGTSIYKRLPMMFVIGPAGWTL